MTVWWGTEELDDGKTARVGIGPLDCWIEHRGREWRTGFETIEREDAHVSRDWPAETRDLLTLDQVSRAVVSTTAGNVTLNPALADRPVVTRPDHEFVVPPGVEATIYVGSPVWLQLFVGPATTVPLRELPIVRPSDTWFGPTIGDGELCYAARTSCRLDRAALPDRPYRATTAVTVRNDSDTSLTIERMKLLVPRLSLYASADGRLWTQDAVFRRDQGTDFASFEAKPGPPAVLASAEPTEIAKPREDVTHALVRAFGSLLR